MTAQNTLTSGQQGFVREMQKIQKRSTKKEGVRVSSKEKQEAKQRMKKSIQEAHEYVRGLGSKEQILAKCKNAARDRKKRLRIFSHNTMADSFSPESEKKESIIQEAVIAMGFTCERDYESEQVGEDMGVLTHTLFISWE